VQDAGTWVEQLAEQEKRAGEPVTMTVIAICATVAYVQTVRQDPDFAIKTVQELRRIVETALRTVGGKTLLGIISGLVPAGGPYRRAELRACQCKPQD
jgi:hypothetical protein